jgi:membrane protein
MARNPLNPFSHTLDIIVELGFSGEGIAFPDGMLAYLRVPFGWKDLLKRSVKEALADNVFDLAAQQAYYFFFALFPALLFVIALASFFPLQGLIDGVVTMIAQIAPSDVVKILTDSILSLSTQNSAGILTFAFFVAIWSSSGAMVSIITTLNAAYDVTESRPWWKARLTAIALTIGIAVFILASMFLVIAGPTVAEHLASRMQLGPAFKWAWWVLQWPVVFALAATAIGLVYYFAPDVEQEWVWITPGSILATMLWLAVSLGLKLYYQLMPNANAAYGTIGGVMVLMLWFYCSGLALLLGAELNAEIEHASPYGKKPGERVPGEKKVIGPRAERLYEEKKAKGEIPIKPIPDDVNCDIDRAPAGAHAAPKPSDLIIGAVALASAAVVAAKKVRNELKKSA